jgi:hypothetical protein
MAAAYEGKAVKQWLMDLAKTRLAEMKKRGILAKGKGWDSIPYFGKDCQIRSKA